MEIYIAKLNEWRKQVHGETDEAPAPPGEPEISLRTKLVDALPAVVAGPQTPMVPEPSEATALETLPTPPTTKRHDRRKE